MAQPTTLPPVLEGRWLPMTCEELLTWAPDGAQAELASAESAVRDRAEKLGEYAAARVPEDLIVDIRGGDHGQAAGAVTRGAS